MIKHNSESPLIAICMTTYNPSLKNFKKQIESIKQQNYQNWICIINDDCSYEDIFQEIQNIISNNERFDLHRNNSNLGFYNNFEKCLELVPENAEFVAFSDQDDYWYKDKLSTLIEEFDENTNLVYSDMNIVDSTGKLISKTYWNDRENNFEKLDFLLFANTITGASSIFRKKILEKALPFPTKIGDSYHDWWIACVALTEGKIKYVDKPLYDYIQHEGNVLGHFTEERTNSKRKAIGGDIISFVGNNLAVYDNEFLRIINAAKMLQQRCTNTSQEKQKIINEIANYQHSTYALFLRAIKSFFKRNKITLGAEKRFVQSLLIRKLYITYMNIDKKRRLGKFFIKNIDDTDISSKINFIKQKVAPLRLQVSSEIKERINILIPTIDFRYFFGGYIGMFNIAKELSNQGKNVRIIIVDHCDFKPDLWKVKLKNHSGLENFFDKIEVEYAFDRFNPIIVNENDVFLATTWWCAHIANDALMYLNRKKFIYLIQEYEPFTFDHGTFFALANETYTFPHYAIFSTEFLREYFKQNSLGVFKNNTSEENFGSISFENAITKFKINKDDLKNKTKKKFLFYARPEQHASRNMFELGIIALSNAIRNGCFNPTEWEFHGIGAIEQYKNVNLVNDVDIKLLPRVSLEEYKKLLPQYDVGLSLMLTPHPNLLTIEMASVGMIVVTNSFANKNQETLSKISSNILVAKPTISDIERVLCDAAKKSSNLENRLKGSHVNWATSWTEAFNEEKMKKILQFVDMC